MPALSIAQSIAARRDLRGETLHTTLAPAATYVGGVAVAITIADTHHDAEYEYPALSEADAKLLAAHLNTQGSTAYSPSPLFAAAAAPRVVSDGQGGYTVDATGTRTVQTGTATPEPQSGPLWRVRVSISHDTQSITLA